MQFLWMSHEINLIALNITFQNENAFLKQSHQSKIGYKYMIWHIDEKLF